MGKILDLFNGITLPQQTKTVVLSADKLYGELEARAQNLESQLLHAQAELNPVKRENERYKEKIAQLESPSKTVELLFNQTTGTHVDHSTGIHYCTRCLSDDKRSPLKNEEHGWRCMVCKARYDDPARPWPQITVGGGPLA